MKIYVSKRAEVTKALDNGKEYYVITQPIKIDHAIKLLEHARTFVLGKEIAYSNALALLRIIKQTAKYTARAKIYTKKIGQPPDRVVVEVKAKSFPKILIYILPAAVEIIYDKTFHKKSKILEAYIPSKKYINRKTKNKNGGKNERHNRNT